VNLTAENTAIVVDSTADFPEAPGRFANWRIVPLYVRFGDESHRDYVDLGPAEFYRRLRTAPELPTTSQPTPGDFLAAYEELTGYERIYSLHIAGRLSGTVESARAGAAEAGADHLRIVD
jgi:DegV family protein with EDD domain